MRRQTPLRRLRAALPPAALALLAGCTVGPDFKHQAIWSPATWFASRPAPPPQVAPLSEPVSEPIDPNWWNLFHDAELTSLENRVAAANLNVRLSTIRLAESRSQRQITGADQFATLQGDGSYTRERVSQKGVIGIFGGAGGGGGGTPTSFGSNGGAASGTTGRSGSIPNSVAGGTSVPPFNLFQYGFDASWELDLWGRVRREIESAAASLEASTDARRNSLLSVVAEVARDYVQLRGQQTQLAIARDNIVTEQESVKLSQDRFRAGLTTDLDVANAAAQLQTTQATVPQLEQQEAQSINALSFLLGVAPGARRAALADYDAVLGLDLATLTRATLRVRPAGAGVGRTLRREHGSGRTRTRCEPDGAPSGTGHVAGRVRGRPR